MKVHYVGVAHSTGEEFDASYNRGEPLQFRLGIGQVIPGWDTGVQGMKVGGRRSSSSPPPGVRRPRRRRRDQARRDPDLRLRPGRGRLSAARLDSAARRDATGVDSKVYGRDVSTTYSVSELAAAAGSSPDTLRYYEKVGLLHAPRRTPCGYRRYDDSARDRLAFIRGAQRLGLTLADVRDLLAVRDTGDCPCEPAERRPDAATGRGRHRDHPARGLCATR